VISLRRKPRNKKAANNSTPENSRDPHIIVNVTVLERN
jgi:hypothetical protein